MRKPRSTKWIRGVIKKAGKFGFYSAEVTLNGDTLTIVLLSTEGNDNYEKFTTAVEKKGKWQFLNDDLVCLAPLAGFDFAHTISFFRRDM